GALVLAFVYQAHYAADADYLAFGRKRTVQAHRMLAMHGTLMIQAKALVLHPKARIAHHVRHGRCDFESALVDIGQLRFVQGIKADANSQRIEDAVSPFDLLAHAG